MRGAKISLVQRRALEILMLLDAKTRAEDFIDRVKLALLTHNPEVAPALYPQWIQASEGDWEDDPSGFDASFVNPMDPALAEELLSSLAGDHEGILRSSDLEGW